MSKYLIALSALALAACGNAADKETPEPQTPPPAEAPAENAAPEGTDYTDMANWLCHPDKMEDACAIDLTVTSIAPDGSTSLIESTPAENPAFDCFYIYPTVSLDMTPNSDLVPGREEINVIAQQFARFSEVCRLYAPMYRQTTIPELQRFLTTGQSDSDLEARYSDIERAWTDYMENHNNGRGVLLIGHSQGADMIYQLLTRTIPAGDPVRGQLISVYAIGYTQWQDGDGNTSFGMPVCTAGDQTGCLVSFGSFRATQPPPATSFFGIRQNGQQAICTNPAELSGDEGELLALMPRKSVFALQPYEYGTTVETEFVALPGLLSGACTSSDTHDWLEVTINADPADARADDIPGDVVVGGEVQPDWGLHLIDMNLTMGNLIKLARSQADVWLAANN